MSGRADRRRVEARRLATEAVCQEGAREVQRVPRLLWPGAEVCYVDHVRRAFRSRVFWSRAHGTFGVEALAIPVWVRTIARRAPFARRWEPTGARRWEPFDHGARDELRRLFNFGPVTDEHVRLLMCEAAPPFFVHVLAPAGPGRAKLRHALGSYNWEPRAPHRSASWALRVPYAAATTVLPEPYGTWWRTLMEFGGTT